MIDGSDITAIKYMFDVKMLLKAVKLEFLTFILCKEVANFLHLSLNCLMMFFELSTSRSGNGFPFLLVPGCPNIPRWFALSCLYLLKYILY